MPVLQTKCPVVPGQHCSREAYRVPNWASLEWTVDRWLPGHAAHTSCQKMLVLTKRLPSAERTLIKSG
eukprot:4483093-Amphidinium_carterae.1